MASLGAPAVDTLSPDSAPAAGIEVSGAGLAVVNGTYVPSGLTNNIFQRFEHTAGRFYIAYYFQLVDNYTNGAWALFDKGAPGNELYALYLKADGAAAWVAGSRAIGKTKFSSPEEAVPPVVTPANAAVPVKMTDLIANGVVSGEARAALGAAFVDARALADAFVKATVDLSPERDMHPWNEWNPFTGTNTGWYINLRSLGSPFTGIDTPVAEVAVCRWVSKRFDMDHHGQPEETSHSHFFACVRGSDGNW